MTILARFNSLMTRLSTVTLGVTLLATASCGGGGGGGGGGESDSSGDSSGVRVLHAAIDASPVDVLSSASDKTISLSNRFALAAGYHSVPSGAQTISLTKANLPGQILASTSVTSTSKSKTSILLYGDTATFGLRTKILSDDIPSISSGAVVRVVNGTTGAASMHSVISGGGVNLSTSTDFGDGSEYLPVAAGATRITSTRASDGQLANSVEVTLQDGRAYTLLLAGQLGYYVKATLFTDN